MKRSPHSSAKPDDPRSALRVGHAVLRQQQEHGLHSAVFAPLHYEKNYAYPLVVWLHGPDDDERQVQRVMPQISMRNYVAVAPRGVCEGKRQKYGWSEDTAAVTRAENAVFMCIDQVSRKYHIAAHRIFLAGYGIGGTVAFRLGLQHPQRFAGVLSVSGPFPTGDSPLRNLDQLRQLPLFLAHGRQSASYPVDRTCEELRLFHAAGLAVTFRQYPGSAQLDPQILHDMDVWIMEQVTGMSSASEEEDGPTWLPSDHN